VLCEGADRRESGAIGQNVGDGTLTVQQLK
jgi:hypothetical protein